MENYVQESNPLPPSLKFSPPSFRESPAFNPENFQIPLFEKGGVWHYVIEVNLPPPEKTYSQKAQPYYG